MTPGDLIGISIGLLALLLLVYYFHRREKRWEQAFFRDIGDFFTSYQDDPELLRRVARLLLVARFNEKYPKQVEDYLRKWEAAR